MPLNNLGIMQEGDLAVVAQPFDDHFGDIVKIDHYSRYSSALDDYSIFDGQAYTVMMADGEVGVYPPCFLVPLQWIVAQSEGLAVLWGMR